MTVPPRFSAIDVDKPHSGFGVVPGGAEVREWMGDDKTGWLKEIRPAADEPPTRASVVLEEQVKLLETFSSPAMPLFLSKFAAAILAKARELGVENAWDTGMMFYPYAASDASIGEDMAGLFGRQVKAARSYQVTCKMVDEVTSRYNKKYRGVQYVEDGDLPSDYGFAWLDKPLHFIDGNGKAVSCRALLWGFQEVTFSADRRGNGRETVGGVRVTAFARTQDPDDYTGEDDRGWILSMGLGDLTVLHTFVTPYGTRFGGWDKNHAGHTQDDLMGWVHVLWMMMEAEISASRKATDVARPVRRRAQHSLKHSEVTVVTLRRQVYVGDEPAGKRHIDWSCRWVVQEHWRHIDHYDHGENGEKRHHAVPYMVYGEQVCRTCWHRNEIVRVTRIESYWKGPEDRPRKATGQQLYRLAR